MKVAAIRAASAGLLALFCAAVVIPGPVSAQTQAPAAAKASKATAAKKVKKRAPSKSVMALQTALNRHGAKLKVDGFSGARTRAALKKYQAANGLKATGVADKSTKAKLGI